MKAEDFYSKSGVVVADDWQRYSFTTIKVLPELRGKIWNDLTLGVVLGLNPDRIRVTTGAITLSSNTGVVTVFVDGNDKIINIDMGVRVSLPEGVKNAYDLTTKLGI